MQLDDILVTMGPIFGIILCGFLAGHSKLLGALSTKSLSGYVYYFALPALLFETTAQASLRDLTNWGFVMASLVGIAASFICAFFLIRWLFHVSLLDATLDSMAAAYGNTGYMGVPLLSAALGQGAVFPATLAVLLHNVPVVTAVTVLAQCSLPARNAEQKAHLLKDVGKAIFGNPLNLAVIGGLSLAFIHVSPPLGVMNFAHLLAGAAGPTGLFILGLSLAPSPVLQKGTPSNHREVAILVLFKIGLQPLVTCFFALVVFHITPLWASVTVLMAAMPIGANVAIFAQRYDVYALHISRAILASTLLSLLFLPIGIILLKQVLG
jgi:malonate transporter